MIIEIPDVITIPTPMLVMAGMFIALFAVIAIYHIHRCVTLLHRLGCTEKEIKTGELDTKNRRDKC